VLRSELVGTESALQCAQERHQILLLLRGQLVAEHQVEELDCVVQRQQTLVMQVGRVVLDAAQREGFDLPVSNLHQVVDHFRFKEALRFEIMHQVVGIIGRLMAARALALTEEDLLTTHFGWRRLGGIKLAKQVKLGRGREVQHLLDVGHEVDLAAALERVHALLRSDHDVAVEIGRTLLELGEILDRLQGTLRAEQPLKVHAAERHRLEAVTEPLRAGVGGEVCGAVLVPVRMAVEAGRTDAGQRRLAVVGGVELLLRERRHQQPQPFQLPGRENAVEQLEVVGERDQLALRDIAQIGSRDQVSTPE